MVPKAAVDKPTMQVFLQPSSLTKGPANMSEGDKNTVK